MVGLTELIYHALQLDLYLHPTKTLWNLSHTLFGGVCEYYSTTSCILILIIASDPFIHMNYFRKFNIIMTAFRVCLKLPSNIIFAYF